MRFSLKFFSDPADDQKSHPRKHTTTTLGPRLQHALACHLRGNAWGHRAGRSAIPISSDPIMQPSRISNAKFPPRVNPTPPLLPITLTPQEERECSEGELSAPRPRYRWRIALTGSARIPCALLWRPFARCCCWTDQPAFVLCSHKC